MEVVAKTYACWVCGSLNHELYKSCNIVQPLSARSFAITDSDYGVTGELHRCNSCGFIQCVDIINPVEFYERLEDPAYDEGRTERKLQFEKLLSMVKRYNVGRSLLDVGAGSGMLVEQALVMGFSAEGIEPSQWLQARAKSYGLPVHLGTFPNESCSGPYDIIMLVDIIEHITNPIELIKSIRAALSPAGIVIVVTPDVGALLPRLLGNKWWHYRIAHIGYFNKRTLNLIMKNAGFELVSMRRPSWYFKLDYLYERGLKYLPGFLQLRAPSFFSRIVVPLNPRDSLMGIYKPMRADY